MNYLEAETERAGDGGGTWRKEALLKSIFEYLSRARVSASGTCRMDKCSISGTGAGLPRQEGEGWG